MLGFDHTNTLPLLDPVATVVLQADTRNVDTVFVNGQMLKRDGRLVGVDLGAARRGAEASLEYLLETCEMMPEWVQSSPRHQHASHAH
jgi:hypothetical protein